MALRNCSAAHCSGADAELNAICKQEGWAIGHPVITRDAQGPCQCHCSCLALDTPVASGPGIYREIQNLEVGDDVWACGVDLSFRKHTVEFSDGTQGKSAQPFSIFLEYGDTQLIVTSDHLFLLPNGKLKRADRLSTEDRLVAPDGSEVVIRSVSMGTFYGGFHHVATSRTDPKGNLDGHLLDTNGVISADYAVQLFYEEQEEIRSLVESPEEQPIVGTTEYTQRFGEPQEPEQGRSFAQARVMGSHQQARASADRATFVPMSKARSRVPDDAVPFIQEDIAKELETYEARPLTSSDAQSWAEYLTTTYALFYPEVIFEIDWYDARVNAFAWIDGSGIGHVMLLGGLIRMPQIEIEGLSLVTAHEVSHLVGGPPYYPGTRLSCEGQADFFGVRNVMRNVWFGEYYFTMATRGITQMQRFFGLPPFTDADAKAKAGAGCGHPPGPCRIETYNDAVDLKPKPACAG